MIKATIDPAKIDSSSRFDLIAKPKTITDGTSDQAFPIKFITFLSSHNNIFLLYGFYKRK